MKSVTVGISDCAVLRDTQSTLVTHALGSCIAIAIHDPVVQVSGLLHFMLPDSTIDATKALSHPYMYADTGIPLLFRAAYGLGAVKQRLVVTVLGGAQVLDQNNTFNIGKRNYLATRKIFWKAGVLVQHEEVGGSLPRSVRMDAGTGRVVVYYGREEREITQGTKERSLSSHGI